MAKEIVEFKEALRRIAETAKQSAECDFFWD